LVTIAEGCNNYVAMTISTELSRLYNDWCSAKGGIEYMEGEFSEKLKAEFRKVEKKLTALQSEHGSKKQVLARLSQNISLAEQEQLGAVVQAYTKFGMKKKDLETKRAEARQQLKTPRVEVVEAQDRFMNAFGIALGCKTADTPSPTIINLGSLDGIDEAIMDQTFTPESSQSFEIKRLEKVRNEELLHLTEADEAYELHRETYKRQLRAYTRANMGSNRGDAKIEIEFSNKHLWKGRQMIRDIRAIDKRRETAEKMLGAALESYWIDRDSDDSEYTEDSDEGAEFEGSREKRKTDYVRNWVHRASNNPTEEMSESPLPLQMLHTRSSPHKSHQNMRGTPSSESKAEFSLHQLSSDVAANHSINVTSTGKPVAQKSVESDKIIAHQGIPENTISTIADEDVSVPPPNEGSELHFENLFRDEKELWDYPVGV
jgi:hypothetical protein